MLRKVELNYIDQQTMEIRCKQNIKKWREVYSKEMLVVCSWNEQTDERILKYGREGYKKKFADYAKEQVKYYHRKLQQIKEGCIYE